MTQLAFELAERGAEVAAKHADAVHGDWTERAFAAFRAYAKGHFIFTTEDVIDANETLPPPPDKRAWGQVARRASRLGICTSNGIGRAKSAHAHGRWVTIWQSNECLLADGA